MEFPMMVYRCPGPHARPGGTIDWAGVKNEDELIARMEAGWYETVPEAIAAHDSPPPAVVTLAANTATATVSTVDDAAEKAEAEAEIARAAGEFAQQRADELRKQEEAAESERKQKEAVAVAEKAAHAKTATIHVPKKNK